MRRDGIEHCDAIAESYSAGPPGPQLDQMLELGPRTGLVVDPERLARRTRRAGREPVLGHASVIQRLGSRSAELKLRDRWHGCQSPKRIPLQDGISPLDSDILQPPAVKPVVDRRIEKQAAEAPASNPVQRFPIEVESRKGRGGLGR